MQKTSFPFEIVIGEDCSTDGTREIVMDYKRNYPDDIRVITSDSNVGASLNFKRTNLSCEGEFIAYCEGDDYWIDPLKLQKQYDAFRINNPKLVTHSTFVCNYVDGRLSKDIFFRKANDKSGFLDIKDIILLKSHFHTSSFFMQTDFIKNLPEWINQSPVGDYPVKVIAAHLGGVYFIDEFMSVYQKNTPGSFTDRKQLSKIENKDWMTIYERNLLSMYKSLDQYTDYKYSDTFRLHIQDRYKSFYKKNGNLDFLEIKGIQKTNLKLGAFLSKPMPKNLRERILNRIISNSFKNMEIL